MSNKTKKIGMWSLKALAVGLFVLAMLYNIQIITGSNIDSTLTLSNINNVANIPTASAEESIVVCPYKSPNDCFICIDDLVLIVPYRQNYQN